MSSLLFKPIPHFHSPSLENNSWHLFRSSKTEELKAGCIDTESPLFFLNHDFINSSHTSFLWSTLDDGTGQVNCWSTTEDAADAAKGFPALGIPHCWGAHTTPYWVWRGYAHRCSVAPRIPTIPSQPNSSSILGSCHFQTFVSEQQLLLARRN